MRNKDTELVSADALDITKVTGFGSVIAGVISAAIAALGAIKTWDVRIQVALLALAAVALVVAGLIVIADIRARSRLAMWVVPQKGDTPARPLLQEMWQGSENGPSVETFAQKLAEHNGGALTDEDDLREVAVALMHVAQRHPQTASALANGLAKTRA